MADVERQSQPETTVAPAPDAPGATTALLTRPAFGDPASLVGALASGSDEWRADVIESMQRTSGNRAVLRMLARAEASAPPKAQAAGDKKTGIAMSKLTGPMAANMKAVQDDWDAL